jgi:type I restriction enzyme M protein
LLLKVGDEAERHNGNEVKVTLYGQEKDNTTAGLARMNMILHDYATAEIKQGNTLTNPLYKVSLVYLPTCSTAPAFLPASSSRQRRKQEPLARAGHS